MQLAVGRQFQLYAFHVVEDAVLRQGDGSFGHTAGPLSVRFTGSGRIKEKEASPALDPAAAPPAGDAPQRHIIHQRTVLRTQVQAVALCVQRKGGLAVVRGVIPSGAEYQHQFSGPQVGIRKLKGLQVFQAVRQVIARQTDGFLSRIFYFDPVETLGLPQLFPLVVNHDLVDLKRGASGKRFLP